MLIIFNRNDDTLERDVVKSNLGKKNNFLSDFIWKVTLIQFGTCAEKMAKFGGGEIAA